MSLTCTIESGAESEWQEAMTHETQLETDTGNGSVTYDELKGPYLDAAHWSPARLPLPRGGLDNAPVSSAVSWYTSRSGAVSEGREA